MVDLDECLIHFITCVCFFFNYLGSLNNPIIVPDEESVPVHHQSEVMKYHCHYPITSDHLQIQTVQDTESGKEDAKGNGEFQLYESSFTGSCQALDEGKYS